VVWGWGGGEGCVMWDGEVVRVVCNEDEKVARVV
jgi:hypothetical protein